MARRSTPVKKIDDARFPVRIRVSVPANGFGQSIHDMHTWLNDQIGADRWAKHSDGPSAVFYFFAPNDATRFLSQFPHLELKTDPLG